MWEIELVVKYPEVSAKSGELITMIQTHLNNPFWNSAPEIVKTNKYISAESKKGLPLKVKKKDIGWAAFKD